MADFCAHCHEEFVKGDAIMPFNNGEVLVHHNCGLREIIGSVAHLEKNAHALCLALKKQTRPA